MIVIKVHAYMLLIGKMVFSDYTKKRRPTLKARTDAHMTRTLTSRTRSITHFALARVIFAPVPSDSLVVLLYRSWLQHWIALNFSIKHEQA